MTLSGFIELHEQRLGRTENPCVAGSIPAPATILTPLNGKGVLKKVLNGNTTLTMPGGKRDFPSNVTAKNVVLVWLGAALLTVLPLLPIVGAYWAVFYKFLPWIKTPEAFTFLKGFQGRIVAICCAILIGVMLYCIRRKWQFIYGMAEVIFAGFTISIGLRDANNLNLGTLVGFGAGCYFIVRGMVNMGEGRQEHLAKNPVHQREKSKTDIYQENIETTQVLIDLYTKKIERLEKELKSPAISTDRFQELSKELESTIENRTNQEKYLEYVRKQMP